MIHTGVHTKGVLGKRKTPEPSERETGYSYFGTGEAQDAAGKVGGGLSTRPKMMPLCTKQTCGVSFVTPEIGKRVGGAASMICYAMEPSRIKDVGRLQLNLERMLNYCIALEKGETLCGTLLHSGKPSGKKLISTDKFAFTYQCLAIWVSNVSAFFVNTFSQSPIGFRLNRHSSRTETIPFIDARLSEWRIDGSKKIKDLLAAIDSSIPTMTLKEFLTFLKNPLFYQFLGEKIQVTFEDKIPKFRIAGEDKPLAECLFQLLDRLDQTIGITSTVPSAAAAAHAAALPPPSPYFPPPVATATAISAAAAAHAAALPPTHSANNPFGPLPEEAQSPGVPDDYYGAQSLGGRLGWWGTSASAPE